MGEESRQSREISLPNLPGLGAPVNRPDGQRRKKVAEYVHTPQTCVEERFFGDAASITNGGATTIKIAKNPNPMPRWRARSQAAAEAKDLADALAAAAAEEQPGMPGAAGGVEKQEAGDAKPMAKRL